MLNRFFEKYTGALRNLKAAYVIHNLLNWRSLRKNRTLYQKIGLQKSVLAPVGHRDFVEKNEKIIGDLPWLDQPDALDKLTQHVDFQSFSKDIQAAIHHFVTEGYLVLPNFFSSVEVDLLNAEIAELRASGKAGFNYTGRKIFNVHEVSPVSDAVFFKNKKLLELLAFLFGRPAIPFQTLHFIEGSEQKTHSDSIHMTTEPPGFMAATWTALEPVGLENGTLIYYPKSHRLPFISTEDYDSGNTTLTIGQNSNQRYEEKIAEIIEKNGLKPAFFEGNAGDVFIWHANLLHGGSSIRRPGATRKSMVAHYFAEGVICYHEMTQRPAILKS
jgi:ectoine hydroxylase